MHNLINVTSVMEYIMNQLTTAAERKLLWKLWVNHMIVQLKAKIGI